MGAWVFTLLLLQIAVLANIGGSNLTDFVKRALSYIFTPETSRLYNVTGQKGKEPFNRLQLFQVIVGELFMLVILHLFERLCHRNHVMCDWIITFIFLQGHVFCRTPNGTAILPYIYN